jgi:hypothetical protein
MSGDPRIEAAANALHHYEQTQLPGVVDQARAALAAADAADREAGIHRVKVDDATVERVARALVRHRWPTALGDVWGSLGQGTQDDHMDQACAVLAALTEATS